MNSLGALVEKAKAHRLAPAAAAGTAGAGRGSSAMVRGGRVACERSSEGKRSERVLGLTDSVEPSGSIEPDQVGLAQPGGLT